MNKQHAFTRLLGRRLSISEGCPHLGSILFNCRFIGLIGFIGLVGSAQFWMGEAGL